MGVQKNFTLLQYYKASNYCCRQQGSHGTFQFRRLKLIIKIQSFFLADQNIHPDSRTTQIIPKTKTVPVQKSHAAHRQWLLLSLGICSVSATAQPTCPLLVTKSRAQQGNPGFPTMLRTHISPVKLSFQSIAGSKPHVLH